MSSQMMRLGRRLLPVVAVLSLLAIAAPNVAAQQASPKRIIIFTVTDPMNRFVTGLEQEQFEVTENSVSRPIASFLSVDEPIAVAVVSETPVAMLDSIYQPGEVIQTRSLSDAIRALEASNKRRKALILTSDSGPAAIPGGIVVMKSNPLDAPKAVIEVRNQYTIAFTSAESASQVAVTVKPPRGLPTLKTNLLK